LQLASALKQKETSGSFRVKVTAAKMFGVVGGRGDGLVLTPLGNALVDPKRRRKARVDAFLNIPLYAALYEGAQQRSGMMPENLRTIEQEIIRLGVVENQAETARLAFTRSARFAGFLEHGKDRLIMPALNDVPDEDDQEHDDEGDLGNGGGEVSLPGKPTILVEVFKMLPGEGEPFEPGARRDWQRLLTATLDMLYQDSKGPDGGSER
jgi:hypothetical protein